jgi:hypothetical protein
MEKQPAPEPRGEGLDGRGPAEGWEGYSLEILDDLVDT